MKLFPRINNWIYQLGYKFLGLFGLLFFGLLSLSSLLVNFYAEDMEAQISVPHMGPFSCAYWEFCALPPSCF